MTNNINHLKEIVNQAWVKHSKDLLYLRNPTAQDMEILVKTCLIPLALKTQNDSFAFVHELKQEMHADLKYVKSLEDELDELESDKAEFSNMECDCLAQKLSEQTEFVSKEISLKIALQQCQEQLKNDTVCKEKASNVFRKEREQYFEIQDLKAQLQDKNIAISELKKLIEKCKGKSVDTKFDKPSVVRQPNAQRIPKPSVLGKPAPFSDSLERKYFAKKKSVLKTNESEGLSGYQKTAHSIELASNSKARVARKKANVSRPQPRSNQMKDKDSGSRKYHSFKRVYYGRGLNHNLFSVGQFCDADLEVAFQKYTCFVRDLQGNDLLTTSTNQAWFRLEGRSHLNFDYINLLSRKIFVIGLPKLSLSRINYVPILQVRPRSPNDKMCRIMTNPDPVLRITKVYPFSSKTVPSQQELDLLFGPLYDEFFNDGTSRVNKSSSPTDNSIQKYTLPSTHIQPTSEPTTPTNDDAEENNNNQAEFTNPCCTPPVQTRRQLATDPEMCMFALTVSTAEPKNIKEAMADSAWIEAMQEELHQFDRLQMGREKRIFLMAPLKEEVYVEQPDGFVDPDHPDKVLLRTSDPPIPTRYLYQSGQIYFRDSEKTWSIHNGTLGDKLVSWMSKKQDCTTMSSAEAEYVALSAVVIQVENGIIELYFVRTEFQLADMFTKALFEERIHKDGDSDALFQLKSDSLPHIMLNLQDILSSSRFKDNQESSRIKDKDFRKL
ncbi:hypothetical protein Tco_0235945 [Tanacetum coccineum]